MVLGICFSFWVVVCHWHFPWIALQGAPPLETRIDFGTFKEISSLINFWWRSITSFLRPSGVRWVKWEHLVPRKHHMKQWVFIQHEMLEWSRITRSWKKTGPSKLWRSQVFHQRHSLRGLTPICSTPMEFVGVCPHFQKKTQFLSLAAKRQPLLQKLVTQKQVTPKKKTVSQSVRGGGSDTLCVGIWSSNRRRNGHNTMVCYLPWQQSVWYSIRFL